MSDTNNTVNNTANPGRFSPARLLSNRRFLILAAMAIVGAGSVLNWGWLSAVGAAPLILALAPCAVMCGLGLCMKGCSKSCSSKAKPSEDQVLQRD